MTDFSSCRTNLDKYLDDLFTRKLQFSTDSNVIRCLQESVESCVTQLLNILLKQEEVQAEITLLREEYQENYRLLLGQPEVLCVGSFYEETKNTFPDEFDFVLVLLTAERFVLTQYSNNSPQVPTIMSDKFFQTVKQVCLKEVKKWGNSTIKLTENSYFIMDLESSEQTGPAMKLRFSVHRRINEIFDKDVMYIDVDVTPAIRVKDKLLSMYVGTLCSSEEFSQEIIKTGSFMLVQKRTAQISFIETEIRFMKTCLSLKHKRVYRLLKYIINGDLDERKIKEVNKKLEKRHFTAPKRKVVYFNLSSYVLKMLVLNHHLSCTNNENSAEAACLLDILKKIQHYVRNPTKATVYIPGLYPKDSLKVCSGQTFIRKFDKELTTLLDAFCNLSNSSVDKLRITSLSCRMFDHLGKIRAQIKKKRCQKRINVTKIDILAVIVSVLVVFLLYAISFVILESLHL